MIPLARFTAPFRALARFAPTRRLALLVLLVAPLWLVSRTDTGAAVAAAGCALIALAALADALRIPGASHLTVTRTLPAVIGTGDTRTGTYEISSAWPAAVRFHLAQRLTPLLDATLPRATVSLGTGGTVSVEFTVTGQARGQAAVGPVALVVQGPWGLARRSLIYDLSDTISVVPRIAGAGRYRMLATYRARAIGQRVMRRRGAGTSFANLRDYARGDDPRRMDWKASARRNRLISREFTVEQGQTVVIAVDAGRMMTQMAGDRPRFEYALAAALTLADVALAAGDRVGLLVFDDEVRRYIPPAHEPRTLGAIRDALVGVAATMAEPDYAAAFRTLTERHRRRSLIVLFTDVVDVRSSRAVIALTARSAERHLPLVVALRNEQLAAVAQPAADAADARTYEAAAAEELLSARQEALETMRQAGVAVLDASPAAMTAALIDRYLEIKERAAL